MRPEQGKWVGMLLSPRFDRRELAETRQASPGPTASAFQRRRMTLIRLCGLWWSCRDFGARPNTKPNTKRSV